MNENISYIAIILSVAALVLAGFGITIQGPEGPRGPCGEIGEQGPIGPEGPRGLPGKDLEPNEVPVISIDSMKGDVDYWGEPWIFKTTINDKEGDLMEVTFYHKVKTDKFNLITYDSDIMEIFGDEMWIKLNRQWGYNGTYEFNASEFRRQIHPDMCKGQVWRLTIDDGEHYVVKNVVYIPCFT